MLTVQLMTCVVLGKNYLRGEQEIYRDRGGKNGMQQSI